MCEVFNQLEKNKKEYIDKIMEIQIQIDHLENEIDKYKTCINYIDEIVKRGKEIEVEVEIGE